MIGTVQDLRSRGRPQCSWICDILAWTHLQLETAVENARTEENRAGSLILQLMLSINGDNNVLSYHRHNTNTVTTLTDKMVGKYLEQIWLHIW